MANKLCMTIMQTLTMEIIYCLLLLTVLIPLPGGMAQDDLDGPSPAHATISPGTTHTLQCSLRLGATVGTVLWEENVLGGEIVTISLGTDKRQSLPAKYDNFEVDSDGSSYWNLQILNVEAEDFGTYSCGVNSTGERDSVVREVVGGMLDGPSPAHATILTGTTHTLQCSLRLGATVGIVLWEESVPGGGVVTIFRGTDKSQSLPAKYDNFEVDSDGSSYWNLQIVNVEAEDSGTYSCGVRSRENSRLIGERDSVVREVVVQATSLQMTQNGADVDTVTVIAGTPSDIVCTALGAIPDVTVEWWHRDGIAGEESNITSSASGDIRDNGDGTYDTVSTLTYDTIKDFNEGDLRCVTTGQEVAESREDTATLNVQYSPVIEPNGLQYSAEVVSCIADGNPAVLESGYTIITNETAESDEYKPTCSNLDGAYACRLDLKVDFDTDVRCYATNDVGMGTRTIVAEPGTVIPPSEAPTTKTPGGTDVPLAAGISVLAVAVAVPLALIAAGAIAIAIIVSWRYHRYAKEHPDKKDSTVSMTIRNPQQLSGAKSAAAGQTYMDLDRRNREGQRVYQEPQSQHQGAEASTYEDIGEGSNSRDDEYQEVGQPASDNSTSKAYVNVPQMNKGNKGKR